MTNTKKSLEEHFHEGTFSDVTLVSEDGQEFRSHKLILSSSSKFFSQLLTTSLTSPNPVLYLKGSPAAALEKVLEFVYTGQTSLISQDVPAFLAVAADLKLRGIESIFNDSSQNQSVENHENENSNFYTTTTDQELTEDLTQRVEEIGNGTDIYESGQILEHSETESILVEDKKCTESMDNFGEKKAESGEAPTNFNIPEVTEQILEKKIKDPQIRAEESVRREAETILANQQIPAEDPMIWQAQTQSFVRSTEIRSERKIKTEAGSSSGAKLLYCEKCDYTCKRRDVLRLHMSSKHDGPKFRCELNVCGRVYSAMANLRAHMKSCHNCDKCNERFDFIWDLKTHKRQAHGMDCR